MEQPPEHPETPPAAGPAAGPEGHNAEGRHPECGGAERRVDHDALFKELLRAFFVEFLDLFVPEVAGYLERDRLEFLDKEVFTDVTAAERHEVDVLVKAKFQGRPAFFLVHVENQSSAREGFAKRMFRYFARLHERHDLPVYPIALFSHDAPRRPEPEQYTVAFPDTTVLDFRFRVIQLNRLDWRDFAERFKGNPNPVANALMTRMRIDPRDRPRVKLACLRMFVKLKTDPARKSLVGRFIHTYLRLTAEETSVYNQELKAVAPGEQETVMEVMSEWEEMGWVRGLEQGRQEGMQQGMQQGMQEGVQQGVRQGRADLVLSLLGRRFGDVPEDLRGRLLRLPAPVLLDLAHDLWDFADLAAARAWLDAPPDAGLGDAGGQTP